MNIPEQIKISCMRLFCGAPLEGPDGVKYSSGDLIKCQQCGEGNDFDSVVEVAKEKGMKQLKDELLKSLKNTLKK
jgi:hypothetical protein